MRIFHLVFVFVFCSIFISCEKNESLFEEMGDGTLLKEVLIDGETYYEYTYNEAGLVVEEKSKFHYSNYSYNSKEQLTQSDHYWDESIASSSYYVLDEALKRTEWVSPDNTEKDVSSIFKYHKSGRLEKITTYRLNNNTESYSTYTYNKDDRIERRTSYDENKASMYEQFFYDELGNLIRKERFNFLDNGSEELSTTTEYEFDNMYNPYISFRGLMTPGKNTNPNNIIKETYTIHFEVDDFIDKVQVSERNYEYNKNGYPTQMMEGWEFVYY